MHFLPIGSHQPVQLRETLAFRALSVLRTALKTLGFEYHVSLIVNGLNPGVSVVHLV